MDIKELSEINYRYVRIRLNDETEKYINTNFEDLLTFIGNNYPLNDRDPIGCAYKKIQMETDKLLHVSWKCNWKLKTSKREVKSIRQASYWLLEGRKGHYYIRIPYKIGFIFSAIIQIVKEILGEEGKSIPDNLKASIEVAYGVAFYSFYIEQYERLYDTQFKRDAILSDARKNPAKLHDVFYAPGSSLRQLFP